MGPMVRSRCAGSLASLLLIAAGTNGCGGTFYWDVPLSAPLPTRQYNIRDPNRIEDGRVPPDVAPEIMCGLVREGAFTHRNSDLGWGVALAVFGGLATATGTSLAASSSTLAPEPRQQGWWIGGWASLAGVGLVSTASAIYLIVKSGQDRQEYWLANAAVAKIRADYAQYPVMMSDELKRNYNNWYGVAAKGMSARKAYEDLLVELQNDHEDVLIADRPIDPELETAYHQWLDIRHRVDDSSGFASLLAANPAMIKAMPAPVLDEYKTWVVAYAHLADTTMPDVVQKYAKEVSVDYSGKKKQYQLAQAAEAWSKAVLRGLGSEKLRDELATALGEAYSKVKEKSAYAEWDKQAKATSAGERLYERFTSQLDLERGWQVTGAGHADAVDQAERAKEAAAVKQAEATGAQNMVTLKTTLVTADQAAYTAAISAQQTAAAAYQKAEQTALSKRDQPSQDARDAALADLIDAQAKRAVAQALLADALRAQEAAQRNADDKAKDAQRLQIRATDAMNVMMGQQAAWTDCATALTAIGTSDAAASAAFQSALGSSGSAKGSGGGAGSGGAGGAGGAGTSTTSGH